MNGNTLEELWMLVDSGEATAAQKAKLTQRLETNPDAAATVAELEWLCRDATAAQPETTGPSQATLDAVMAAAATRVPSPQPRLRLITWTAPAVRILSYAAAAAIIISGWLALGPGNEPTLPTVERDDVQALLLVVTETDSEETSATSPNTLNSLADQMLEFQGFGGGSLLEDELLSLLQEDEPSTTPQARRTPVPQAGICG